MNLFLSTRNMMLTGSAKIVHVNKIDIIILSAITHDGSEYLLVGPTTDNLTIDFTIRMMANTAITSEIVSHLHVCANVCVIGRLSTPGKIMLEKNIDVDIVGLQFVDPDVFSFDRRTSGYMPKYKKLTEKEIGHLLKRYIVGRDQLPKMISSDVVCQMYGFKKNDVIEVLDQSMYRIVI